MLQALDAQPGERVVEVGCGGGRLLREIGSAVGEAGSAVGFDLSREQVEAARSHCAHLGQVVVAVGDARSLSAADDAFDASVTTQVLEYVPDVAAAMTELARVTRPGGRFVNVATLWSSLGWHGGDAALTRRVLAAWDAHAPHPDLPTTLPGLLRDAGFVEVRQQPLAILDRVFQPDGFAFGAAHLMAAHARSLGGVDGDEAEAWLESLRAAGSRGTLLVAVIPVLTTALRARRG